MAFRTPFRPLYTLTNYDVYCELNFTATKYVLQKWSEWWRMFSGQTQIPRRYKPGHGPLIRCEKRVVWIDSWHESYIFSSNENSLSRGTKKYIHDNLLFKSLEKLLYITDCCEFWPIRQIYVFLKNVTFILAGYSTRINVSTVCLIIL